MDFYTTIDQEELQSANTTDFEPMTRPRSNTWPLPRPDPPPEYTPPPTLPEEEDPSEYLSPSTSSQQGNISKKSTSRRNAWGNLSYADLITQAITSSPESRLTLSQIYDWMVTNVPYFKDKGDSNSSAGWKNSIRHNLSLHNRFMRVQNEGTGKSSWWMLNPDAKPGKAARRRATTLETSKYEKKRGRIKKKLEQMRNGLSPSGASLGEGLEGYGEEAPPPHFSPLQDSSFRPRTSSNASSIGPPPSSRLSPLLDDQLQFYSGYFAPDRFGAEALAASLGPAMNLGSESPSNFDFGQPPPFRSHSFGVSSHYSRPQLAGGSSMRQQLQPSSSQHPHSTSMDQLHLSQFHFQPQQSLFQDIKPDLDFNLEQLEPSFTTTVDEEVLRSELMSSELLAGFGEYIEEGQQQFGLQGQQQPQQQQQTPNTLLHYGGNNQQHQHQQQQMQLLDGEQQQQGRQWVH